MNYKIPQFNSESGKRLCSFRPSKNVPTQEMKTLTNKIEELRRTLGGESTARTSLNLDEILQNQAKELFILDPISIQILENITLFGPQNIHSLSQNLDTDRGKIGRRIRGSPRFIGLEKEWFISIQRTQPFRETGLRHVRYYNLLFKGFLASLTEVRLEENTLFRGLIQHLNERVPSHIRDEIVHYIKYEMAAWLQTHVENRFELTYLKDALNYYLKTKDTERFFRHPENNWVPVFTDGSLETSPEVLEVENYRSVYSETWAILAQNKIDLTKYIYDTYTLPKELLNDIFLDWPNVMLHRLQEPS